MRYLRQNIRYRKKIANKAFPVIRRLTVTAVSLRRHSSRSSL